MANLSESASMPYLMLWRARHALQKVVPHFEVDLTCFFRSEKRDRYGRGDDIHIIILCTVNTRVILDESIA